ncbi:hypothetical protein Droror1_Dr00017568 [Drosera rotundifolia]
MYSSSRIPISSATMTVRALLAQVISRWRITPNRGRTADAFSHCRALHIAVAHLRIAWQESDAAGTLGLETARLGNDEGRKLGGALGASSSVGLELLWFVGYQVVLKRFVVGDETYCEAAGSMKKPEARLGDWLVSTDLLFVARWRKSFEWLADVDGSFGGFIVLNSRRMRRSKKETCCGFKDFEEAVGFHG